MGKAAREVAFSAGVDHEHIASQRLVGVFLQGNVVELGHIVFKLFLLHHFFNEVLPVIPSPRLVDLPEVLNDEGSLLDAILVDTNGAFAFGMHSESSFIRAKLVVFE